MNNGALSIVLYIIFIFIFIGSWISDELQKAKWSARTILFVLFLILVSPLWTISVSQLTFGSLVFFLPIIVLALMLRMDDTNRVNVVLGALLFAGVYNLLFETFAVDPILLIMDDRLLTGILLGTAVGMFRLLLHIKWLIASFGMWLGALYFVFKHSEQLSTIQLFSYYDIDMLFTLYLSTTLTHLVSFILTKWVFRKLQNRT